jgi:FkbM family methyltransferase
MAQDILARLHRLSRPVSSRLGFARPIARAIFGRLLAARYGRGLMRARQNDREWLLAPEVALRGEFQEFGTTEWLRGALEPGMMAIDVGANVGQMTLECAALVGPTGRVLAIEPGEGNLELLRCHVTANGFADRVEIIEGCCADLSGTITLFVVGAGDRAVGSGHTLAGEAAVRRQGIDLAVHPREVAAYTIDELCEARGLAPDVVKIDVEGAELQVLRGMARVMSTSRPLVRVGFHPFAFDDANLASDELRAVFKDAGYVFEGPSRGPLSLDEYEGRPLNLWAKGKSSEPTDAHRN